MEELQLSKMKISVLMWRLLQRYIRNQWMNLIHHPLLIYMKACGYENSWNIGDCSSEQQYGNNQEYTQECCLREGKNQWFPLYIKTILIFPASSEELMVTCYCSYGDGWHGGYLEINGQRYFNSFAIQEKTILNPFYSSVDFAKHSLMATPHLKLLAGLQLHRENWYYC